MSTWVLVILLVNETGVAGGIAQPRPVAAVTVPQATEATCTANARWVAKRDNVLDAYCLPTGYGK